MNFITDEILKVIKQFGLDVEIVSREEYKIIFQKVISIFTGNNLKYPLWSSIIDKVSIRDANGWIYIPQFIDSSAILFLEKEDAEFAVIFKQPNHFKILLENSFHFVFYITNPSFDYLLCFNDHDYLIGSGSSKKWIASLSSCS